MKFVIMAGELADAVGWVSHALPKRAAVPVLAGILVEAGGDGVTLSAFDYDTSRRIVVELDAPTDPGKILVPGRMLADIAKAFPKRELVDVAADDREIVIRCGRSEYAIPLMPVDDYPSLPATPAAVGRIHSKMLGSAVGQVAVAASTDDSLPTLTGVWFEVGDDGLAHLVATDRYRIAWRTLAWSPTIDGPADVKALIPAKVLADIVRGLPEGDVEVSFGKGLAGFTSAGRTATVRLLEETFISFRNLFDKTKEEAGHIAEVDCSDVAKAVKRVALMAERSAPVRLSFAQDVASVEAGSADAGRAAEPVDCTLEGDAVEVAFDPGKLLNALGAFAAGPVRMRMVGHGRPCLFTRDGDDTYRHLVMSIRLS